MCLAHKSTWQFGLDEPSSASSPPMSFLSEAIVICSLLLLLFMDVCACMCVYLSVSVCLCLSEWVCVWTYVCLCTYLHSPPTLVIMNNPTLFGGSSDNVAPRWACMVLSRARLAPVCCEGQGSKCFRFHRPSRPCCNHSWQPQWGAALSGKLLWHRDSPLGV